MERRVQGGRESGGKRDGEGVGRERGERGDGRSM